MMCNIEQMHSASKGIKPCKHSKILFRISLIYEYWFSRSGVSAFKHCLFFLLEYNIFYWGNYFLHSLFNPAPVVVLSFSFLLFLSLGKVVHLDLFAWDWGATEPTTCLMSIKNGCLLWPTHLFTLTHILSLQTQRLCHCLENHYNWSFPNCQTSGKIFILNLNVKEKWQSWSVVQISCDHYCMRKRKFCSSPLLEHVITLNILNNLRFSHFDLDIFQNVS